jgi:hypothetical protein
LVAVLVLAISRSHAFSQQRSFSFGSITLVADAAMPQMTEVIHADAVLRFQSNALLAWFVVFGETPNFGLIAVD